MTTERYEYEHVAGYSRLDHLAEEIIARAARHLGLAGDRDVARELGMVSRAVGGGSVRVSLPVARGTRQRMRGALRRAEAEMGGGASLPMIVIRRVAED